MAGIRPGAASTDVTVRGLSKAFSGTAALSDVDLAVRPGELLALLGPSGSGKTTLLRVIAGLEVPDRGEVLFGGEDVTDAPVQERGIGFVFQHYALFRHLTVEDNIAYGPRSRRRGRPNKAALKTRIEELLALVQLEGYGHRFPAQLSGGQRQRVALARALATDPRVLLLDEPFGALDAQVRKDLRRWLRDIHRETGQTTIFVTHDQDEAMELADRVAILHRGRLEQVGTPDEVYDEPASGFVMSFVGESSAIPIEVAKGTAFCAGRPLSVPVGGAACGAAMLHVRPQAFRLLGEREDGLHGTVVAIRRAGRSRLAEVLLTGPSVVVEVEDTGHALGIDDDVSLGITEGRVFTAD